MTAPNNARLVIADNTRSLPEAGPRERLSQAGDNLPNVVQYLQEQHPERLAQIFTVLSSRVPNLERIDSEPILGKFTSDGILKMLAYLTVLHDPDPPSIVGIEEPENQFVETEVI